jgi:hypothetical protein
MMVDRSPECARSPSWPSYVGVVLLAGAATIAVVTYRSGFGDTPEDVERRNAEAHECDEGADCTIWRKAHPGRSPVTIASETWPGEARSPGR